MNVVSDIRAKVERDLASLGVQRGEHLLLALSGGVDSLALLDVLLSIETGSGLKVSAAHLDHSVRGEQSEKDARAVESLCAQRNIPIVMGKLTRSEVRTRKGRLNSLEAALRELRYEFLNDAAGKTGSDWIITAHHSDDQAETVLFRALRRMNWRSFTGMKALESNVLRPLLNVTRIDLESYCLARGLKHLEDETNLDLSFSRNRLRHQVIPELEKSFHPSIKSMLLKVSDCCVRLEKWETVTLDNVTSGGVPSLLGSGFEIKQYASTPEPIREGLALKLLGSVLEMRPKASLLSETMKMLSGSAQGTVRLP
ncbi:MAG: tRNA lysidine(34) synthetase TilS [bacterium]